MPTKDAKEIGEKIQAKLNADATCLQSLLQCHSVKRRHQFHPGGVGTSENGDDQFVGWPSGSSQAQWGLLSLLATIDADGVTTGMQWWESSDAGALFDQSKVPWWSCLMMHTTARHTIS